MRIQYRPKRKWANIWVGEEDLDVFIKHEGRELKALIRPCAWRKAFSKHRRWHAAEWCLVLVDLETGVLRMQSEIPLLEEAYDLLVQWIDPTVWASKSKALRARHRALAAIRPKKKKKKRRRRRRWFPYHVGATF